MNAVQLQLAFLRRDWLYETTYRGMMLLQIFGITGSLVIFYSIGRLVGDSNSSLEPYGGEYFPFALIGLVVSDFFAVGLRAYSNRLRLAQTTGTLEAMFLTQTSRRSTLICSGTWDILVAAARLAVAVAIGALFLDVRFDVDVLATLVLAVLSLISFIALGLIAAALILVIKRGDAVASLGNIIASIFAGALFPIALLPDWLRWVAYVLPLHYALDGLRKATLVGDDIGSLSTNLLALLISVVVLGPLSLLLLNWSIRWVQRDASIAHY
jgi:ABC-2 type transport system permease protein